MNHHEALSNEQKPEIREGSLSDFEKLPTDNAIAQDYSDLKFDFLVGTAKFKIIEGLDGKPEGFIFYYPAREKNSTSELRSLWVSPEKRGKGLGELLAKTVIDELPEGEIVADIVGGETADRLFTRLGFRPVKDESHLNGYTFNKRVNLDA